MSPHGGETVSRQGGSGGQGGGTPAGSRRAAPQPARILPGGLSGGLCRTLPYDTGDPALARATWSRLAEPADPAAAHLVGALGASQALGWLVEEALTSDGQVPASLTPPVPSPGDPARAGVAWAQAAARWAPRLEGLDIRRELDVLHRLGGHLVLPGQRWWPPGLDELEQPPFCLWVRGDPAVLAGDGTWDQRGWEGQPGRPGQPRPGDRDDCPAQTGRPGQPGPAGQDGGPGWPEREAQADPPGQEGRTGDHAPASSSSEGGGHGGCVAVVGARASTRYGEQVASEMADGLASRGVVVVSGGAFGIDAAAHRGALRHGPTVSVSAGGVDRLYPAGNASLLQAVIGSGALVAEVPPGCAPARHRFLTRNRLIAAVCQATVVVEAAWRSGALSTAHHAQELGRAVGAVPGPVTSMASVGCHRLLRGGAVCVTGAEDALELAWPLGSVDAEAARRADPSLAGEGLLDGLDPAAAVVLDSLPARAWAATESVVRACGLSGRETTAALGLLELAGRVERAGSRWRRRRPRPSRSSPDGSHARSTGQCDRG